MARRRLPAGRRMMLYSKWFGDLDAAELFRKLARQLGVELSDNWWQEVRGDLQSLPGGLYGTVHVGRLRLHLEGEKGRLEVGYPLTFHGPSEVTYCVRAAANDAAFAARLAAGPIWVLPDGTVGEAGSFILALKRLIAVLSH
jgi:hypothetical protein